MTPCRHACLRACRSIVITAGVVWTIEAVAFAQPQASGGRSGGLLPTRETPSISGGRTREEMLRRFDLDANGRIDEGEAEAARARMRRERVERIQKSGIDPLTGRLRGAPVDAAPPVDEDLQLVPGNPTDQPPPPPNKDAAEEKKPPPPTPPALPLGRAPVMTGGVRAGAPAVRSGYGATGPKQDLNAGRPREPQSTPGASRTRPGMQPAGRPFPQPAAPRAASPRPGLFPPSSARPTAEDIGR